MFTFFMIDKKKKWAGAWLQTDHGPNTVTDAIPRQEKWGQGEGKESNHSEEEGMEMVGCGC